MESEQVQTQTAPTQAGLFADELPSLADIRRLCGLTHTSEANIMKFAEQVEANMSRTGQSGRLATGIGLYILGRNKEAVDKLEKATDCKEKYIYLGCTLRRLGRFDEAIKSFDESSKHGAEKLSVTLEKVATYRRAQNFDAAHKQLKGCANFENVSAEYHYQLARLLEAQGQYDDATENYKLALELAPDHPNALFHLAYRCDLAGDEEAAMDYYRAIGMSSPMYVSALLNLAVLYEDAERYDKAVGCVDKVLDSHPNHKKALLFRRDIESSKTMVYDEEREKKRTRQAKILDTPISDFELSVRSRNCLRKMHIDTLGDLLRITEAELLSYKNFGETSLHEIKDILEPKGLRLGMATEDEALEEAEEMEEQESEEASLLSKPVDDLQLSVRARSALQRLGIRILGDLTQKTEAELLGCKNFGVTSLNEIKKALTNLGLGLRMLD